MPNTHALHVFAGRCPQGHRPAQTRTLSELQDRSVPFYCPLCGRSWMPAAKDRELALDFAEASQGWVVAPLTAA